MILLLFLILAIISIIAIVSISIYTIIKKSKSHFNNLEKLNVNQKHAN